MLNLSKIPYLIEAIRSWAMDIHSTPELVIETSFPGVQIPKTAMKHVKNDIIVLNVHDRAIDNFDMSNDHIQFATRFSGQIHHVQVPIQAIIAIISREQHDGIVFRSSKVNQHQKQESQKESHSKEISLEKRVGKPHLQLVK